MSKLELRFMGQKVRAGIRKVGPACRVEIMISAPGIGTFPLREHDQIEAGDGVTFVPATVEEVIHLILSGEHRF